MACALSSCCNRPWIPVSGNIRSGVSIFLFSPGKSVQESNRGAEPLRKPCTGIFPAGIPVDMKVPSGPAVISVRPILRPIPSCGGVIWPSSRRTSIFPSTLAGGCKTTGSMLKLPLDPVLIAAEIPCKFVPSEVSKKRKNEGLATPVTELTDARSAAVSRKENSPNSLVNKRLSGSDSRNMRAFDAVVPSERLTFPVIVRNDSDSESDDLSGFRQPNSVSMHAAMSIFLVVCTTSAFTSETFTSTTNDHQNPRQ